MENGSNSFFLARGMGEDREWSSLQGPTCSEGAAGPALDLLCGGIRGCLCVGVCRCRSSTRKSS